MPSSDAISALAQHEKGLKTGKDAQSPGKSHRQTTAIDTLPDSVLLEIFDFCRLDSNRYGISFRPSSEWHRLVHVCQRWRHITFASPSRLDLALFCTYGTPVRKNLPLWPPLPITMDYCTFWGRRTPAPNYEEDVIAGLEHPDRMRSIKLALTSSQLRMVAPVMQVPFPTLTDLCLSSNDRNVPLVLPDAFLGGAAPQLLKICLVGIALPVLPTLLLSANDLVYLRLEDIPQNGYISPEAMVTCLAPLTMLSELWIWFKPQTSRHEYPPHLPLVVLPSLTTFYFHGFSEYLEHFLARISTPRLHCFKITYFNQLIDFRVPQLSQFIGRENFQLARFIHARIRFNLSNVYIELECEHGEHRINCFTLRISCEKLEWQVSHLARILGQSPALVSNVGHLTIDEDDLQPGWQDDTDDADWLDLLGPFNAVRMLRGSEQLSGHIALALDDVSGEMVTEVLPALEALWLDDQPVRSVEPFIAMRRHSGHPIIFFGTQVVDT